MSDLFKRKEAGPDVGAIECTREGVDSTINELGLKDVNLEAALERCNTEVSKRYPRGMNDVNLGATNRSLDRNPGLKGPFILTDELRKMLPSLQNSPQEARQIQNNSTTLPSTPKPQEPTPAIQPQNPLSAQNKPGGINSAIQALGGRSRYIDAAVDTAVNGKK